jgi:hypothetical protein
MTNTETDLKPTVHNITIDQDWRDTFDNWSQLPDGEKVSIVLPATPDHGLDKVKELLEPLREVEMEVVGCAMECCGNFTDGGECRGYCVVQGEPEYEPRLACGPINEALAILDGLSSPVVGNAVNDGEALEQIEAELKNLRQCNAGREYSVADLMLLKNLLEQKRALTTQSSVDLGMVKDVLCDCKQELWDEWHGYMSEGDFENHYLIMDIDKAIKTLEQQAAPDLQSIEAALTPISTEKDGNAEGVAKFMEILDREPQHKPRLAALLSETPSAAGWQKKLRAKVEAMKLPRKDSYDPIVHHNNAVVQSVLDLIDEAPKPDETSKGRE